jgi:hypothetical protein
VHAIALFRTSISIVLPSLVLTDDELVAMGGVTGGSVRHLEPGACDDSYFPFSGGGMAPACKAGAVAEFRLASSSEARHIEATLVTAE